jgi:hypothetical protein
MILVRISETRRQNLRLCGIIFGDMTATGQGITRNTRGIWTRH